MSSRTIFLTIPIVLQEMAARHRVAARTEGKIDELAAGLAELKALLTKEPEPVKVRKVTLEPL